MGRAWHVRKKTACSEKTLPLAFAPFWSLRQARDLWTFQRKHDDTLRKNPTTAHEPNHSRSVGQARISPSSSSTRQALSSLKNSSMRQALSSLKSSSTGLALSSLENSSRGRHSAVSK
eukprot:scaffold25685_cov78-Phaeocystis_antarctica.AAC.2